MASAREVKRRIKGVKSIMQVTRALEAVSASKVRRATQAVVGSRAYTDLAWDMLINIAGSATPGTSLHPLLDVRKQQRKAVTILLITGDRGLAGAYNTNIIRVARHFATRMGLPVRWVTVGRKGRDIVLRMKGNVVAEFTNMPPRPTAADVGAVTQVLIDEYLSGNSDEVYIAFTDFINSITQKPRVQRLLPLTPMDVKSVPGMEYLKTPEVKSASGSGARLQYEYEPNAAAILVDIVPKFTQMVVYQALLEALASEHSARMVAMRNATDSANDLIGMYQLAYNKARQMGITSEILDIVGGAEALKTSAD